jgi:methenyltetrahydromethanopterin cyclohydrolase
MSNTSSPRAAAGLSVNLLARPLLERLLADADALGLRVRRDDTGVHIVDAGIEAPGSVAAGLCVGEICMGGLGRVNLRSGASAEGWPTWLDVRSSQPVLACLGSQYAGWSLAATKEETGGKKFFSLGSGPARALAVKEKLFAELDYRDHAPCGALVLEVDRAPPKVVIDKLLRDCGLAPEALTLILTPTTSLAGTTQVVARVLEVALHKAHELGFALADIVDGAGTAPLPSRNSRDHGRSFAHIFKEVEYDFYKIDGALFAPAEVWVSNIDSGNTWHSGAPDMELLQRLWLQEA